MRMPSTRNEEYRYTDVAPILHSALAAPAPAGDDAIAAALARHELKQPTAAVVAVVDGAVREYIGCEGCLPEGVYIGSLAAAPKDILSFALVRGVPFCSAALLCLCILRCSPCTAALPSLGALCRF
jgi:Fe-S cluster assembly protein SufD